MHMFLLIYSLVLSANVTLYSEKKKRDVRFNSSFSNLTIAIVDNHGKKEEEEEAKININTYTYIDLVARSDMRQNVCVCLEETCAFQMNHNNDVAYLFAVL